VISDVRVPLEHRQPYSTAYEQMLEKVRYERRLPNSRESVAAYAGPDLITRILHRLPTGYALLFGRAELTPAA
jgi:hypothetical protein